MQNYLIIGVHPTPNGPLHLGHISGPFLTLDIFARCKNMLGHNIYYISGSDSFESHVLMSAEKEKLTPKELVERNTNQIQQDLKSLSINLDFFIPLHTSNYQQKYFDTCYEILRNVNGKDEVKHQEEFIPIDIDSNKYLIGCWLSGLCPKCGASAGSYFCEECGAHYKPEELKKHIFNHKYNVKYEKRKAVFLHGNYKEILDIIEQTHSSSNIINNFVKNKDTYITRLTTYGEYGKKFIDFYNNIPFTYTTGLTAFYLLCFNQYLKLYPENANNVKIVTAYGFDNTAAYITGMLPLLKLLGNPIKIDIQFVNKFMLLNNSKFSTSRNHAIWVSSLSKINDSFLEILRVFLCKYSPIEREENFDSEMIAREINEFSAQWNYIFSINISKENINITPYEKTINEFKYYCEDATFNPKKLVEIFINHLYCFEKNSNPMSFILILLFLGKPFLPNLTKKILKRVFNLDDISFACLKSIDNRCSFNEDLKLNDFNLPNVDNSILSKLIGINSDE